MHNDLDPYQEMEKYLAVFAQGNSTISCYYEKQLHVNFPLW